MIANLTSNFSFNTASDLMRIGRDNDGGYLVSKSDIDNSDVLIGLGINDDWSFESDFKKIKDVEVFAYDASISHRKFLKRFTKSLKKFYKPKNIYNHLKTFLSYRNFFLKLNNYHIEKFVGLDADDGVHCTLDSILDEMKYQSIFLKIDIEGSEYRILDTLVANQNRISGLVIEFHDCDLHLKSITSFINKINLKLAHIHANNFAPIRASDGLPTVLEITFSKHCKTDNETTLPHKLDMPNWFKKEEIQLIIE